jgi:hypothetical protein
VAVFAFVWGAYLANAFYDLFYPNNEGKKNTLEKDIVMTISKIASVSTGLLLTLIRLAEPYFRYQVKKRFLFFFAIDVEEIEEEKRMREQERLILTAGSEVAKQQLIKEREAAKREKKDMRDDVEKNPLNYFLIKSLSEELVYVVLTSIVYFNNVQEKKHFEQQRCTIKL